jgi:hypothetical protein
MPNTFSYITDASQPRWAIIKDWRVVHQAAKKVKLSLSTSFSHIAPLVLKNEKCHGFYTARHDITVQQKNSFRSFVWKIRSVKKQSVAAVSRQRCFPQEFFHLLRYYAACGGFILTFRDYLSVPSSRSRYKKKDILRFGHLNPRRWDRQIVPKLRYKTTLRRVRTQKTEELSSAAAEVYDLA